MKPNRRQFLTQSLTTVAFLATSRIYAAELAQPTAPAPTSVPVDTSRRTPQYHDPAVVAEFVSAAHRDLDRVKAMVAQDRKLVLAARDTGNVGIGDWESGLNGAAHVGRHDIALFLLSQGARIDIFCAAMLGYRDVVLPMLKIAPETSMVKGPHNLTLLYHVAISGDVAMAEAIKPLLPADSKDYDQSLSAAARDGRLEMTKWLLNSGVNNVNAPDGFKKTPLKIALEKGFTEVADELRRHGGVENI